MKVLIIGGAGFIGLATTQVLDSTGIHVEIADTMDRLKVSESEHIGFPSRIFNYPDVSRVEEIIDGFDAIIHLAWTSIPASSMESIQQDAQANILSSLEIFRAASKVGTKRVVFSSSGGTVYGIPENSPVTEKCFTRPISAYGISKLSVEHYLDLYKNLNGISLRIGNPYGAYQLRGTSIGLIARVLNSIKEKTPIQVWGDGSIVRDYINIKSVANAFALSLLTKNLEPGAYNIGTGVGRSINDIIQAAFDVTGRKTPVIYSKPRGFDVSTIVLDNSKFSSATGWKTYPESLHEEIEQLWEFLQKVNS